MSTCYVCKGKILEDVETGKETYLDFTPNAVIDGENAVVCKSLPDVGFTGKVLVPATEICAYAEHKELLDKEWQEEFNRVVSLFDKYHIIEMTEKIVHQPQNNGLKRHDLDWQKYQMVGIIGHLKD